MSSGSHGGSPAEVPGRPAEARTAGLLSAVERLWPDSTPTLVARGSTGARATFVVVPSARSPRLLVPVSPRAATAGAVQRYSLALSRAETVQRVLVGTALRLGAGALLPDRVLLSSDPWHGSIQEYLAEVLGERVRLSLGIGNPRANRKPVLQAFDSRGRSLAFVKLGDTPVAAGHVTGETVALERLGESTWEHLVVPRLLHKGSWRGMPVLVMSDLPSGPQLRGRPALRARAERELFMSAAGPETSLPETDLWRRAEATTERLGPSSTRESLRACLEDLRTVFGARVVATGAWHGDWTQWNMSHRSGRLQVWDWERYETGVPAGLDAVHFEVNRSLRSVGPTAAALRSGLTAALGPVVDGAGESALRAGAYLLALATRYAAAAEEPGGEVLADRTALVVDQLEVLSRQWAGR